MDKLIIVDNLTKIYNVGTKNENKVLNDISLEINNGEFVCIMGTSGSGKTTLINNLSTIDTPTKGRISIDGKDISLMNEKELCDLRKQNIGFVFQSFNLIDSISNFENISLPLLLLSKDKQTIIDKIKIVSKKLNIQNIMQKYPWECSGGEIQRVAIARAIISEPKIIVADEPTGNLDCNNSLELLGILSELNKMGMTIIMVTHDSFVASHSSRMLYISDGSIIHDIKRGDLSQKEYYFKIESVCSNHYQEILNKGG